MQNAVLGLCKDGVDVAYLSLLRHCHFRQLHGQATPPVRSPSIATKPHKLCQLLVRWLADDLPLDVQRGGRKLAPIPIPHLLGRLGIVVHVHEGVGDAMVVEESPGARGVAAPVGAIDHDARPGAALFSHRGVADLWRLVVVADEQVADAVARLGDVPLVPVAGADELAILHGIARALLSRAVGPAEGGRLPSDAPDDSLPDLPVGVQPVGTDLRVAQSHAPRPLRQIFQALADVRCLLHHHAPRTSSANLSVPARSRCPSDHARPRNGGSVLRDRLANDVRLQNLLDDRQFEQFRHHQRSSSDS